jgi:hypothetical protein
MLIRMPSPDEHLELPRPRRLIWQAVWSMAESLGLPFGVYIVISDVVSPVAGLLAGTGVVWLLILLRKIVTGSASALLMISAVILTIQTAVAISTGYLWMFELQFPIANLAMCVVFARTAPTRKPLVTQLAAEVVALKENDHPGLHRFFQGATWFWAGLFLLLTAALGLMMVTEPFKLFMLLSTLVTIGLTAAGAAVCAVWFFAVMRRLGLRLHFSGLSALPAHANGPVTHLGTGPFACRGPGSAFEGDRGLEVLDAGEHSVDERRGRVGRQVLSQRDRLADRHRVRHVGLPQELVDAQPQDVTVHGGHPLQRPVHQIAGD